jgi:hypothetical protein
LTPQRHRACGSVYTELSQYVNSGLVTGKQWDCTMGGVISTLGVTVLGTVHAAIWQR